MVKEHLYLIRILDSSEDSQCDQFKIIASKDGKQLPCGICRPDHPTTMQMIEVIDDNIKGKFPYIAF